MDAFHQFTHYLEEYGYLAIFIVVFLQQIGVPNPLTNEFILLFCGYLAYSGTLNIYKAIGFAVLADFAGSILIFFIFYSFSKWLIDHSPKWLPLTGANIEKLKKRMLTHGQRSIFIGRMTPIIRGYTSVVAGMLNINRKAFMTTVLLSAIAWNGGLIVIGLLIGPYWSDMMKNSGVLRNIVFLGVFIFLITFISRYFQRKQMEEKE